jgi:hypothetical protein
MELDIYPGHGSNWGYSVQTWIAREVNQYLHAGTYYCWFSMGFNAMRNGDDSNPIWIYLTVDRAVAQGGVNNAKVKDVKANLLQVIDRELRAAGRTSEISTALARVMQAPLDTYTPQLWRIDMRAVAGRYSGGHQYPDEYLITDLREHEFEVIIP